ncbi:2OG-Fe dioxygenase family protein [Streptomyces catenulae]|uniref:2OG-Fe dioxygenase family protein n=1 Tax=Streptomyces catenulae TaxID=66875 RepID=A0ABV2YZ71_9ACTN|nr:2OG-Fe dioxygenase family protein [Streptomyces catenulae]
METSEITPAVSAEIREIKHRYVRDRSVFVEGAQLAGILRALGASGADLERLAHVGDGLRSDPTLPFRKSQNGRFRLDPVARRATRLEFQPFVLSKEEDFVRHDSGELRVFEEVRDDLQLNTAFQALLAFKSLVIGGVATAHRPLLDYGSPDWICTLFNLRTVTDAGLLGEPALEGVHSDGVDHTMTTLLDSTNMTEDSAVTYLHDIREANGARWHETDPALVVGRVRHSRFLDTLLVVDHERKHSVSPVTAADPGRTSTRDMLIFFTRKPAAAGHISHHHDSMHPHTGLPMSADLPTFDDEPTGVRCHG